MLKVSVITVVRNAGSTIEDTILSVNQQSYKNIEHIVIDGASTDNTLSIIKRHSDKISRFISEPDNGIYDAMNKGLKMSSGDIVGFLNADDQYADNDSVKMICEAFADPSIDACYGDLVYVSRTDLSRIKRYWISCKYTEGLCKKGWMPAHPTLYVRKNIYDKYGVYDQNYKYQSDYELSLRFLEVNKITTKYIPHVLVKMRMGGVTNNSIINIIKGNLEAYDACKKYFPETTGLFIFRKIFSRLGQFVYKPQ